MLPAAVGLAKSSFRSKQPYASLVELNLIFEE